MLRLTPFVWSKTHFQPLVLDLEKGTNRKASSLSDLKHIFEKILDQQIDQQKSVNRYTLSQSDLFHNKN